MSVPESRPHYPVTTCSNSRERMPAFAKSVLLALTGSSKMGIKPITIHQPTNQNAGVVFRTGPTRKSNLVVHGELERICKQLSNARGFQRKGIVLRNFLRSASINSSLALGGFSAPGSS